MLGSKAFIHVKAQITGPKSHRVTQHGVPGKASKNLIARVRVYSHIREGIDRNATQNTTFQAMRARYPSSQMPHCPQCGIIPDRARAMIASMEWRRAQWS